MVLTCIFTVVDLYVKTVKICTMQKFPATCIYVVTMAAMQQYQWIAALSWLWASKLQRPWTWPLTIIKF